MKKSEIYLNIGIYFNGITVPVLRSPQEIEKKVKAEWREEVRKVKQRKRVLIKVCSLALMQRSKSDMSRS